VGDQCVGLDIPKPEQGGRSMKKNSVDVVALVHRIPWSVSFISRGAYSVDKAIRIIQIDNGRKKSPTRLGEALFPLLNNLANF
jgi:hypothetical protein